MTSENALNLIRNGELTDVERKRAISNITSSWTVLKFILFCNPSDAERARVVPRITNSWEAFKFPTHKG